MSRFFRLAVYSILYYPLAVLLIIHLLVEISSNRRIVRFVDDLRAPSTEN